MRVMVNERGQRIGEGHRRAVLTDAEVDQLLEDRGPFKRLATEIKRGAV